MVKTIQEFYGSIKPHMRNTAARLRTKCLSLGPGARELPGIFFLEYKTLQSYESFGPFFLRLEFVDDTIFVKLQISGRQKIYRLDCGKDVAELPFPAITIGEIENLIPICYRANL